MENNESQTLTGNVDFFEDVPSDAEITEALGGSEDAENTGENAIDAKEADVEVKAESENNEIQEGPNKDEQAQPNQEAASEEQPKEDSEQEESSKDSAEKIEVKINGEVQEVTLQELKNAYSGEKEVARRFTELDKEKKSFYNEKSQVEGYISNFSEKMQNGDIVGAFSYFAEFANIPGYMVKEQLVAAIRPEIERRAGLTPLELEQEALVEQNKHLKSQNESETKRREDEQAGIALQNSINSVRETYQISDSEWETAFGQLDKQIPAGEMITPEQVGEQVVELRAHSKASNILSSYEGLPETSLETLTRIVIDNPDFDDDVLNEIVRESLDTIKKQRLESELASKIGSKQSPKKSPMNNSDVTVVNGVSINSLDDWD